MRVAFITSRFPFPIEKGDKLRAFEHIRHLSKIHEVHLFAINHGPVKVEDITVMRELCAGISVYEIPGSNVAVNTLRGVLNGLPAHVSYFLDARLKRRLHTDLIRLNPDHVFAQLIRTAEYVRTLPFSKTLDYMDTFSYGARQRSSSGSWLKRPLYAFEAKRLRDYERRVYPDFDVHTIISEQDRDRLPLPYQRSVIVLANGVDAERFRPMDLEAQREVVFVGNMGYVPNIEAAEFLVKKVMPKVWDALPEARVSIVGARPHARVARLRAPRVEVTGWVDDVRPYYASSSIVVAPMFSGMGQQNKILEAMAMARPCITTNIVNNAIGAVPGEELVLAENALQFADQIARLLYDHDGRQGIARSARAFIERRFTWENQNKTLESLLYMHITPEFTG